MDEWNTINVMLLDFSHIFKVVNLILFSLKAKELHWCKTGEQENRKWVPIFHKNILKEHIWIICLHKIKKAYISSGLKVGLKNQNKADRIPSYREEK